MKRASVAAAERELEWATQSWHVVKVVWERELKETWADFSQIIDDNVSNDVNNGKVAFSDFVGSQGPHTLRNLSEARRGWSAFLSHANRVFSKLEQGAKTSASSPWYGTIIRARKRDPLLQYIHQARDAENHGDTTLSQDTVVQRATPNVRLLITAEALATGLGNSGASMDLPVLSLLPVKTRSGIYMPPKRHLDQDIRPSIEIVAEATLAYLNQIVMYSKLQSI